MSSDPSTSMEEFSEFVRRPTRTAGDLSEVADGPTGLTTEDVARDLESVASRSRTPTEREPLEELLRRVERIEEHLGIASAGPDDDYLDRSQPSLCDEPARPGSASRRRVCLYSLGLGGFVYGIVLH
jgi:hypothetical protein